MGNDRVEDDVLTALCAAAVEYNAADILLHEGQAPKLRMAGQLSELQMEPIGDDTLSFLWSACRAPADATDFDASYVAPDGTRFRVNLMRQLGQRASVLRRIRSTAPSLAELGLPVSLMEEWMSRKSGIVLVCGPTGSGKSTTLAACLDWINENFSRHIVTIEDPIEFVFQNKQSVFSQREVGIDTPTFSEGLRRSLRQSPDVILLGEIRDGLSAATAVQAAETGHLVLATLHASNSSDAVERVSQMFTPAEREMLRKTLSGQLIGILCQRLLPAAQGGAALLVEYFTNIGVTRKFIDEARVSELADQIARSDPKWSVNFMTSLVTLCREGIVTEEVALANSDNPQEFQRAIKGINSGGGTMRR